MSSASILPLQSQEHAAPLLIHGTRGVQSLNGEWDVLRASGLQFNFPPPAEGWKKEKVPADFTNSLALPGNPYGGGVPNYLNAEGTDFAAKEGLAAWFKRGFDFPEIPSGKRVLLRFNGIAFRSEVWLNGTPIGGSLMAQLPVTFDVTDAIKPGSNALILGLTAREGLIDLENQTFLAPASGSPGGIWGDVEIEVVPDLRIDDVFVKTSVTHKKLELEVTVTNQSDRNRDLTLQCTVVDGKDKPEALLEPVRLQLAAGETRTVPIAKDWIAPRLWSPNDPALYFVETRLVEAEQNTPTDASRTRFGFRQFEVRGTEFFLNEKKIVLLRDSSLWSLATKKSSVYQEVREKARDSVALRLHIGFNSDAVLDLCDELGLLSVPESSWFTLADKFVLEKRALWLPQAQQYTREFIRKHRNRPSIALWSLTNETTWGRPSPEHDAVADAILAAAREVDTTRPFAADGDIDWVGKLDTTNIHYPEPTVENSLREKFPNSSYVFPNDYYWLKKGEDNGSWTGRFVWDRPLVIGEYFYPSGEPDKFSSFMGDSVYDWEKWRRQRMDGRDEGATDSNEFAFAQRGLADAYRRHGVAGLNPWASNMKTTLPKIGVRPVDFYPNAFSGETFHRKFVVFNDTGADFNSLNVQCVLSVNGEPLWEQTVPASTVIGEGSTIDLEIPCPVVSAPTKAELSLRLRHHGGVGMQLDRHVTDLFIMPRPAITQVKPETVALLDPSGKTAAALEKLGLKTTQLPTITAGDLQDKKTLIIGEESDAAPFRDAIKDFAHAGGSVIVLRQEKWAPLSVELPELDKEHLASRVWKRRSDHPVTRDFEDAQLSFWRPDQSVSIRTFRKPSEGNHRILLDAGGLFGMIWSPLVESPVGKGAFLLTSLDLVSRVEVEPAAAQLLVNLITYADQYQPAESASLRILAGDNAPLRGALRTAGVVFEEAADGDLSASKSPILVDATYTPSKSRITQLKTFLSNGGNIWAHGFTPESLDKIAGIFPFKPELEPADSTVLTAKVRGGDPLTNNLANYDFTWARIDLESRNDYFENAKSTARLGQSVLKLPSLDAGSRLIAPGFLVKIPVGGGQILFDTLEWPDALGAEAEKVTRIVSALAANQGAAVVKTTDEVRYDYTGIDISGKANMGFYDAAAGDGQGGWTDEGKSDMRFSSSTTSEKPADSKPVSKSRCRPFPRRPPSRGVRSICLIRRKPAAAPSSRCAEATWRNSSPHPLKTSL